MHWKITRAAAGGTNPSPWAPQSDIVVSLHRPRTRPSIRKLLRGLKFGEGRPRLSITKEGKPLRVIVRDGFGSERVRTLMNTRAGFLMGIIVSLPGASTCWANETAPVCDVRYLDRTPEQEEAREEELRRSRSR